MAFLLPAFLLIFSGCSCQSVNPQEDRDLNLELQTGRFRTVSCQKFLSGGRERHIIVLFDNKTERSYLVVMGAGVYDFTETHTSYDGKGHSTIYTTDEDD